MLLYTDGVPDAGRESRPFGEAGLMALCAKHSALPLDALIETVERVALERAGPSTRDDLALLGLRVER